MADKETIGIFGQDVKMNDFRLSDFCTHFKDGYAVLEMSDENRFFALSSEKPLNESYMISGILFDGRKQLKFRRLRDDLMRVAADFQISGWEKLWEKELSVRERHLILWGYKNEQLGDFLYEERIPYLFEYPGEQELGARERLEIVVKEYQDEGWALWSRFAELRKYSG